MRTENQILEFKSGFNDEVIETLTAFANARGGRILVGVNNDGNPVKGFRIGNESVQKWLNEIKNKTVCPLNVYKENLKKSLCY